LQLLYHEKFTEIILQPESTIIITEWLISLYY
jgi:hypothetical protein